MSPQCADMGLFPRKSRLQPARRERPAAEVPPPRTGFSYSLMGQVFPGHRAPLRMEPSRRWCVGSPFSLRPGSRRTFSAVACRVSLERCAAAPSPGVAPDCLLTPVRVRTRAFEAGRAYVKKAAWLDVRRPRTHV